MVAVGGGSTTRHDFAVVGNPGTITGSVTDATSDQPVGGATVSYSGGSTTSDAAGHYAFSAVAEGNYTLTAAASGHGSASRAVTVAAGASVTQDFALPPSPGAITGTVTDAVSNTPIGGASVSYSGGSAVTDSAGQYVAASLPPGNYTITAHLEGFQDQAREVDLGPAQTVAVNLRLGVGVQGRLRKQKRAWERMKARTI